jgi:hypothetical protein
MLGLQELLKSRGFQPGKKRVKIVRHKDSRFDVEALRSQGWFDLYQSIQSRSVFDGCDQIVVFIGEKGTAARFIGVYDIGTCSPAEQSPLPDGCPFQDWAAVGNWRYQLDKRKGFEDLEDRLVVDWGKAALAWHQWFTDRPVLEIRPQGRALPPFRDYLRVHLTFQELRQLATSAEAHRDWVVGLSAVGAIYLIVNQRTGEQYVGSATGVGGLWQRWRDYAKPGQGHGGNKQLQKLCETPGTGCPEAFKFSILETFSRNLARNEAISLEEFFKKKLGTRAFGLNS